MKNAGADFVFLPIYYTPASNILIQADKIGYAPTFFGVDGMDGILTLEGFDTKLAEGVMLLTPFIATAEDEATQNFVKAYVRVPICVSLEGLDEEALIKVFAGDFTASGVTGASMEWNEAGEVNKTPNAMVIENGVYVPVQ